MNNPIDILGVHPSGAQARPTDNRDYPAVSPEIGSATAPFDWNAGYNLEDDTGVKLSRKNQGRAGSCGGQSISEAAQALSAAYLHENSERSAKAYYSQAFVPGGGSNSRVLGDILRKQGLFLEELVPSYPQGGGAVTEAFMDRPEDIGPAARADAAHTAGLFAYVFPALDIDAIAQALRDNKGAFIGIHGYNNGTWLSPYPSPSAAGDPWAHFMAVIGARLINGKKYLVCLQSWGFSAPDESQVQYISEDHFTYGRLWDAISFVYSPLPPKASHVFNTTLTFGTRGDEVTAAQTLFAHDGVFNLAPTGFYGSITARAVLKFRAKHGIDTSSDPLGHSIGPATRAVMNTL